MDIGQTQNRKKICDKTKQNKNSLIQEFGI